MSPSILHIGLQFLDPNRKEEGKCRPSFCRFGIRSFMSSSSIPDLESIPPVLQLVCRVSAVLIAKKTTCRRYRFEPESVNYPFKSYDRFVYPCHLTRDCFCRCTGQSKPNSKFGCNTKSKKIMANNRFYEKHSRLIFLPLLDIQKYSLSNAVRRIEGIMVLFDYCRFGSMTEITSRPPFSALLDKNIRMCLVT